MNGLLLLTLLSRRGTIEPGLVTAAAPLYAVRTTYKYHRTTSPTGQSTRHALDLAHHFVVWIHILTGSPIIFMISSHPLQHQVIVTPMSCVPNLEPRGRPGHMVAHTSNHRWETAPPQPGLCIIVTHNHRPLLPIKRRTGLKLSVDEAGIREMGTGGTCHC